jgi:ABC-type transporter Mla subunit MlaD
MAPNLTTAAGILAVEAHHAGLIRTTMNNLDPTAATIAGVTNNNSTLRATLSQAGLLGSHPVQLTPTLTTSASPISR